MDCFWDLYHEKRIEEITVSEITKATKINRSTFYVYFKDVYDVLDQIENAFLPSIHNFDRCVDLTNPEEVYEYFLQLFDRNYQDFAFLLSENGDPNFINKLKEHLRPEIRNHAPQNLKNDKYIDLTVEYLLSSTISTIIYWANHPSDITSRELFLYLHELFQNGLKGIKNIQ